MPRVYLTTAERYAAEQEAADDHIRILAAAARMKTGENQKAQGARLGISAPTYCKHMKNPGIMTLEEFRRMARELRMKDSDIIKCVLG